MTKAKRLGLQKSLCQGIVEAVADCFFPPRRHRMDAWGDDHNDWEGPEIVEEIEQAWKDFLRHYPAYAEYAVKVRRRNLKAARLTTT